MEQQNPTTAPNPPATTQPTEPSSSATEPSTETAPSTTVTEPSTSETTPPTSGPETDPTETTTEPTTTPATTTTAPVTTAPVDTTVATEPAPSFDFPYGVDDSWFDNTLFIGDSRVVGLRDYARSGNAEYFCDVGMNLFNYSGKQLSDKNFDTQSLDSLLSSRQYDKIIINFGLNEAGYPESSFQLAYQKFVTMVQEKQPNATIILQGIMSVTRRKASTNWFFEPWYLQQMSAYIESLCDGVTVHYIDCNEYFSDSEGYLHSSITNDGYHPTGSGYRHWRNWIAFALMEAGL